MKKSFWVVLTLTTLLVIFSVLNADPVPVNILFKEIEVSLAILLIIVFLAGVIAGASYFFIKSRGKKTKVAQADETTEEINESNAAD
ncbi:MULTISPECIES: lipopolysaccharide assembly protein LapA domain-containing protein [unclassified Carboxylicivirga]|uniref:lipopolysaccharide assembly protein LapA domain-containing protein n=1 Tax=Carboxylicivirga TaxID=1628153 RepID=UPI003D342192